MNKKVQEIRALSIMAVVLIHSNGGNLISMIDRPFVNFAVAMFTFLSGYLTKIEIHDVKSFFRKRILKVTVPYVIWTIIYGVALQVGKVGIIKNLLTANGSTPFYYIFVYIQFVLLTPFIGKLLISKFKNVGWIITPIYVVIVRYICKFVGISLGFPFPATICLAWFTYYYLGMALGNNIILFDWNWKKTGLSYIIALILSLIEGGLWLWVMSDVDMATTQIRLTSIATSTVACLLAFKYITDDNIQLSNGKLQKLLVCIGDRSFGIFFSHIAVMEISRKVFSFLGTDVFFCFPISTAIVFILSFLFAFIAAKVLRKHSWILGL